MPSNFQACKGKQRVEYHGPVLEVIFERPWNNPRTTKGARRFTKKVRLNNPRKKVDAVVIEVCAQFIRENPRAKLVSFNVKGG